MGLGISISDIIMLNKPIYQVVELAASLNRDVVILTDFDKKGKQLYSIFKKDLLKQGVRIDRYFREFLQKILN